jgi:hypothetical protein
MCWQATAIASTSLEAGPAAALSGLAARFVRLQKSLGERIREARAQLEEVSTTERNKIMKTIKYALVAGLLLSAFASPASARTTDQPTGHGLERRQRQHVVAAMVRNCTGYVFPSRRKKKRPRSASTRRRLRQHHQRRKLGTTLTEACVCCTDQDKHRMFYSAQPIPERQKDKKTVRRGTTADAGRHEMQNFGVGRVRRLLSLNIGYLDLRAFARQGYHAETLTAAMTLLATDSMIIDCARMAAIRSRCWPATCSTSA